LVPRQNGKGGYTEAVELGGLFLFGDQIIMHSAHLFKTAKQSFQRLIDIIDGSDWLTKRVARVMRARGDEEIQLTSKAGGGRLLCFSRSGGAGRGFTGDKTVFDECAYLTVEQYQAATPTLATVPNPQIIYTGTPPDEDIGPMPDDAMMPSVRRRGHAGGDRIALWEWSPPDRFDRTDPQVWAACNPALGRRIPEWFLAKQLDNFTAAGKPAKFDTEHLGVWPRESGAQWLIVPEAEWTDAEDLGILLHEKFPDLDPLKVRFTDLHIWVCALPDFRDDPKASTEPKLEAIQMAWLEEWREANE
jgi:FeS assembly protein IscX